MPATDNVLVVLQRLVALVSGSTDFWTAMMTPTHRGTRPVSNFIHNDEILDKWKATRVKRGPAAFPAVFLAPARGREAPGAVQTMCQRVASQVMPYTFTIVGEGTDVVAIGQAAAEIEAALKAAGGQLGSVVNGFNGPAIVATWRLNGRVYERAGRDVSPDVERRQCVVTCEITIKG